MKKVVFLCFPGLSSFIEPIIRSLENESKYQIKMCCSSNNQEIMQDIQWADTVWLEWANEMAVGVTNSSLLESKHVICRCHSYEVLSGYIKNIKWGQIDDLIFVAEHVRDIAFQQISMMPNVSSKDFNVHVIPNGLDLEKFKFLHRENGPNLAFVGALSGKKGPMLLVHAFQGLTRAAEIMDGDKYYHLYIAGAIQEPRFGLYLSHMMNELGLGDYVHFDGHVDDITSWLKNKNYLICTSPFESQNLGICEAMLMGIKPIIHNFVGAKSIYDEKYLWNTIPDFIGMIKSKEYDSLEYRNFITKRFSFRHRIKDIKKILDSTPEKATRAREHYEMGVPAYNEYDYWNRREYPTAVDMSEETNRDHIEYIRKHVEGAGAVLDFGPGIGRTFEAYRDLPGITGCDISVFYSKKVHEAAKQQGLSLKLDHITMQGLDRLPYKDNEFDVVAAIEVFLHQRPQNIMRVMKELARVGRKVVVITWMDENVEFLKVDVPKEGANHCFNYNYLKICEDQGWVMEDVRNKNRQIYFVYRSIVVDKADV